MIFFFRSSHRSKQSTAFPSLLLRANFLDPFGKFSLHVSTFQSVEKEEDVP